MWNLNHTGFSMAAHNFIKEADDDYARSGLNNKKVIFARFLREVEITYYVMEYSQNKIGAVSAC